jgi:cadmium resistance protein CadD (predicted permease)
MDNFQPDVPKSLRFWFVIHFLADIFFAFPLLFWPDKFMSRLVGAALLGIGVESLLGRNATREVFEAMLNLKIIWSSGAVMAMILGIVSGGPKIAWIFVGIFVAFLVLWTYYRFSLQRV